MVHLSKLFWLLFCRKTAFPLYQSIPPSIWKRSFSHCHVIFRRPVPHCITGELKQNKSESLQGLVICLMDLNLWNMHPAGQVSEEHFLVLLLGISLVLHFVYISSVMFCKYFPLPCIASQPFQINQARWRHLGSPQVDVQGPVLVFSTVGQRIIFDPRITGT